MKKIFLMLVVMFTMTVVANAKDYVGDVTNVVMRNNQKPDVQNVTFEVTDGRLIAEFDVPNVLPPHHISFEVEIDGVGTYAVDGYISVFGNTVPFEGTVTITQYDDNSLVFSFSCPGLGVSFDFSSPAA